MLLWKPFAAILERLRSYPPSGEGPAVTVDDEGWLHGPGVEQIPADPSWYYDRLSTPGGQPSAIVWHYTAVTPSERTAHNMARRRTKPRTAADRAASWHVTVTPGGRLVQMVPLLSGAWHCGRGRIGGVPVNRCSIGVELEGHGDEFPEPMVEAAGALLRAVVERYDISRPNAARTHQEFDPARRRDPGPVWTGEHLPGLLERVYGAP